MSAPPIGAKAAFKEVMGTLSGKAAFVLLALIVGMAVLVPIYAPFNVLKAWHDKTEAGPWADNPKCAAPIWAEWFVGKKLPRTIVLDDDDFRKYAYNITYPGQPPLKLIVLVAYFDYRYDEFPNHLNGFRLRVEVTTNQTACLTIKLLRPDKRAINLTETVITPESPILRIYDTDEAMKQVSERYVKYLAEKNNWNLTALGFVNMPYVIFFAKEGPSMLNPRTAEVLKGTYALYITVRVLYDLTADAKAKFVLYGRVHGWAGTDIWRRDLLIGLLWGAPVALAFGIVASVVVSLIQTLLGVISGYFSGKVDEAIQRIAELYMIIPVLPILILVAIIYGLTIWKLLALVVIFSFIGSMTKTVRSMVPSIKAEQYVLAAQSYGAGSWRIIFKHIFPRVLPYMFANIALAVPSYIFLEAALSFLGLGDPLLPTWGKILGEAEAANAAYYGYWWWVVLPAACIGITATAFALLGYAFDKVVNPRLREL